MRGALTCVPMHAATAPLPGTGKSILWDTAGAIVNGDAMPTIATGANLEEMEKRLDAEIIAGRGIWSIDNASMPIGGDALCQAIERPTYNARILGKSEIKGRRNTWSLYATGNNLRLKDDLTRRALLVGLDAGVERPELRRFSGNPYDKVLGARGLYLWAVLTVVLAYRTGGMPGKLPGIGLPFAEWSDLVRSALVWLGYADPVETMEAARENDPSRQARAAMVQGMVNAYGVGEGAARAAAEMVSDAERGVIKREGKALLDQKPSTAAKDLKAAIIQYTKDRIDARYLGNKLSVDRNSITYGLCLRALYDSHRKVNRWYVEKIGAPDA